MKKDIHGEYFQDAIITCACGAKYTVGSTQKEIDVEICSACHPFYTGLDKVLDTAGRVDRFKKKVAKAAETKATGKVKKATKKA
ncbi:MAG: ribosomal protein large subunit ribosomal protein [Candidatus Parcubacteria bacterium]|jgi:large subunit ribosomal protein L31